MKIRFHPHAHARLTERGATETEVIATITSGERFPAKFGRTGFRRNFVFNGKWRGSYYGTKQIETYVVEENGWLVITVIVRYF